MNINGGRPAVGNARRCRQWSDGSVTSRYAGPDRDEQWRKTAIGNARWCRQDLLGREGYTKGTAEQCRKTSIGNARRCRQWGDGLMTSCYTGTDRDEQCRKTSIANTRSSRQEFIGRPGSIFNIFVWVLATQQWKRSPTDGITIALYSCTQPGQYLKSILSSFQGV